MLSLRLISGIHKPLTTSLRRKYLLSSPRNFSLGISRKLCSCSSQETFVLPLASIAEDSPLSDMEDVLTSFVYGKKKATEVAHMVWERVIQKGDTVIDATCGNGYDTLTMLKLVADESLQGRVYGLDIQKAALESTSSLLERSINPQQKKLVKLFQKCHSKMAEVIPDGTAVRLVAFNLGYLPGGDKTIITKSQTTLEALKVAKKILMPGGLISLAVYIGHRGGGQEFEAVEEFSSKLSVENWICCKFRMLDRPLSPILIFLFKKCKN
ncbi:hypothetical protein UlMin_007515 [Ulmus minor]